jgi:putative two-component system response regulator
MVAARWGAPTEERNEVAWSEVSTSSTAVAIGASRLPVRYGRGGSRCLHGAPAVPTTYRHSDLEPDRGPENGRRIATPPPPASPPALSHRMHTDLVPAPPPPALATSRIYIVDERPENVRLLEVALTRAGYERIVGLTDPGRLLPLCAENPPDLLILDLHSRRLDGLELMRRIEAALSHERYLPILALTADATERAKRRALAAGARDFLTKPFSLPEAILRIRNLLETRSLYLQLEQQNTRLADLVIERTVQLENSRLEVLERLSQAVEFRDDVTGQHTRRVGEASARLAAAIGLSTEDVNLIRRSAPLHDVGKIAIPDSILLKRGPLTTEEFVKMQQHTVFGARILSGGGSRLMITAETIARHHHERWDGTGYPAGLHGDRIPVAARIVAIVDVFDAVTSTRPYRSAWSREQALRAIRDDAGRHFDAELVEAFASLWSVGSSVPGAGDETPDRAAE